jgi:glycosyltransferase involved in cell wall biosynthesis
MKVAIVIPAYNEGKMIASVVKKVRVTYPHVFVVDDGSADDTASAAREAGAVVLRHVINRGQGAALRTGIEAALQSGAEVVVTFDADGQMSVEDVASLTAPVEAGLCGVALGSRFLKVTADSLQVTGMPIIRRLTLKAALIFTQLTTGLRLTDTHNGLRAFSREAASKLNLHCDRMAHASEILEEISRHNLRYREIPVQIKYTEYSIAKGQKLSGAFRILRDLIMSSWIR